MPPFDLICLANSKKLSQRCVAGLKADTGEWIRPVSSATHGELTYSQRNLGNDGEPQNFDIIRVGLTNAAPTPSQPENWLIDGTTWGLITRPAPEAFQDIMRGALYPGDHLFGSLSDRIPANNFTLKPAKESLALIKPQNLRWLTDSYGPYKKARVLFNLHGTAYNLPVTDPPYVRKIKALNLGYHSSAELNILDENRALFTISLGEPFQGNCYKLVAAVLVLPATWPNIP